MKTQILLQENSPIKGNRWLNGLFGIEKENIRVDKNGVISQTPHPVAFGDKLKHPYITTDFSESQIEMITPPLSSISETIGFLETLHDLISIELKDEYLWPQSIPPVLPSEEQIPIANYTSQGSQEEEYRKMLASKYGRKKQALSGIHFNISLDKNLLHLLHVELEPSLPIENFTDLVYLKITRQLLRHRWLYVLLFGHSPEVDPSYDLKCRNLPINLNTTSYGLSFRNSCFGYGNLLELFPEYKSVNGYHSSIKQMIENDLLSSSKELYATVRPKFIKESEHISYIEIRFIDINPLSKIGVTTTMLQFIHWFAIYGLLSTENDDFTHREQRIANQNHEIVSLKGLDNRIKIVSATGFEDAWLAANRHIMGMIDLYHKLEIGNEDYLNMLEHVHLLINHPEMREVFHTIGLLKEKGFINFHLERAQQYLEESQKNLFNFKGFEDLELSTQLVLREAVRRGVYIEILDRKENFIRLSRDGNIQYVIQATKTSIDHYANILVMENKAVTKKILEENGIRVPKGEGYSAKEIAMEDYFLFKDRAIVIKPKSTNFGLGITILKENHDPSLYERAVEIAFKYEDSILIEEFIAGKEFRFFVINDEIAGILHRVPANVKGDGKQTIRELVSEKNKDPLRGKGYHTPLERIELEEAEQIFLTAHGQDFETIPKANETVFLRENSNISTGGDSIDFTDEIPESYKNIAIRAAQVLGVKITGLDMIILNYKEEASENNYAILEMNFNPAIHIHCYPYKGRPRMLNKRILDLLGFSEFIGK